MTNKPTNREQELRKEIEERVRELAKIKEERIFIPGETKVNYAGHKFSEDEYVAAINTLLTGYIPFGQESVKFEREFANYLGSKEAVYVNSGSSANLVALTALRYHRKDIQDGDQVITATTGFPTTVAPIIQNRLNPIFVDVELGTYNVSPESIEEAITPDTKAIFMAHTLGNPMDLEKILDIAEKYNLTLIEDSCDSLGSKYDGELLGTRGLMGTFSFYPPHNITTAEGGMIVTDDKRLAKILRSIREWGRDCWCLPGCSDTCNKRFGHKLGELPEGFDHKYIFSRLGYNLKPLDLQGAIGRVQLKKLDEFTERRKKNFKELYELFSNYEQFFHLPESVDKADTSWFAFPLTIRDGAPFTRNQFTLDLEKNNIETRTLFGGNLTRQPALIDVPYEVYMEIVSSENADKIMKDTLFIGTSPVIDDQRLDYMKNKIGEYLESKK